MKYISAVVVLFMAFFTADAARGYVCGPDEVFDEVIFSATARGVDAPRALHKGAGMKDAAAGGWKPSGGDDYYSFDAEDVFCREQGTLEIQLTVLVVGGALGLGPKQEALAGIYDENGVSIFSVSINERDLAVGSYPLHPVLLEEAFGGVGFTYGDKLGGPLGPGLDITVTVTWGADPCDDAVYVNDEIIDIDGRKGPRSDGKPPGSEPTRPLEVFMYGFRYNKDIYVDRPALFVVGKTPREQRSGYQRVIPPMSVAIRSVRLSNRVERPDVHPGW